MYERNQIKDIELGDGVFIGQENLKHLDNRDRRFLIHNYFPPPKKPFVLNLASGDPDIRKQSLGLVNKALHLSAKLRAPFYSLHAGFITDPISFGTTHFMFPSSSSPDEAKNAMDRFDSALKTVLDDARSLGLTVLIENHPCTPDLLGSLLILSPDEFLDLFDRMPSSNLGILLDTGHLNVTAHTMNFDRLSFLKKISTHIRAFHVHDNDGTADTHQPIQPGSWILDVLKRPEFENLPVIIEAKFKTVSELCRHRDWLGSLLYQRYPDGKD